MSKLQCLKCNYYQFSRKCIAYPKKIPDEIFFGKVNHVETYPMDCGITFKELDVNDVCSKSMFLPEKFLLPSVIYDDGSTCHTEFNFKTEIMLSILKVPLPTQFRTEHRSGPKKSKE